MFEITIKIDGCCYGLYTHAEARIQDLETKEQCVVSFSPGHEAAGTIYQNKLISFYEDESRPFGCINHITVKLYSNQQTRVVTFLDDLNSKFHHEDCCNGFGIFLNNCCHAIDYTMNYFFPISQNKCIEAQWQVFKCITFPVCIGTVGLCYYSGSPPFLRHPNDIIMKAKMLSKVYGDPGKVPLLFSREDKGHKEGPSSQSGAPPPQQRMS